MYLTQILIFGGVSSANLKYFVKINSGTRGTRPSDL